LERETRLPLTLPAALKFIRTVWSVMIISLLLFPAIAEKTGPASHNTSRGLFFAITLPALLLVASWRVPRVKYIREGARRLAQHPGDARALRRWQTGHIISFMLSEAVALYGLILRYEGFSSADVVAFSAAGFMLMLFSAPRAPRVQS
jgi:FtsH-binding integral membrane protein